MLGSRRARTTRHRLSHRDPPFATAPALAACGACALVDAVDHRAEICSNPGMADVATRPEDVNRLFGERLNAGDIDGLIALYEPDATLVTAEGTLIGHAAIREFLQGMTAAQADIDMGTQRVVPSGADLAVVHHEWRANLATDDGQRMVLTGKATEVVRRQSDGRWLFVFDDPNLRD
jgi:uncharacterized protein (TIGR02246 family)